MQPTPEPELRLTGTRVAEFFRFGCERQLRYELVPPALRGGEVPLPNTDPAVGPRIGARAGSGLLVGAGRAWERKKLRQLIRKLGEDRVALAGWTAGDNPMRLPYDRVVALLRAPGDVEVLVQPELRIADPAAFCARFGLDAGAVTIAPAVPDLIRVRRLRGGRVLFQVVDIKASAEARASHHAQVAFYSLVLEEVCRVEGLGEAAVDVRWGRIWSRDGRGPRRFALAAYRHHVARLLREEVADVVRRAPRECDWHLAARCAGCDYFEHCRAEADATDDVARVPGITRTARRVLAARGIRTVTELAGSFRKDTYQGCHALESQAERLRQRAQAVRFGKLFDVETRTHLMPPSEDVRVILTAEGDPVSGLCFALGLRVDAGAPRAALSTQEAWLCERDSPAAEGEMLDRLLTRVDEVLAAVGEEDGRGMGASLHFFVFDRGEFDLLRRLLLRHLPDGGAQPGIARLLRLLSPRSLAAQPRVARSSPGTVVADAVEALFALPIPYAYELGGVSARLQPAANARSYRPAPGYAWPFSSQIAFERIHNVWRGRPFGERTPAEVRATLEALVLEKLAAIDSVVRAVRERAGRRQRLQLRKEPFGGRPSDPPLAESTLETLRVFTELEAATEAVQARALHVLPSEERARRFECIRAMHLVERRDDGSLVFEFDRACRDVKFRVGEFNLLLTNDDDRSLAELERQPWKRRALTVELAGYDLAADPPRVVVAPSGDLAGAEARRWIDLDRTCVLDRAASDFSTARVLATLRGLAAGRGEADSVLSLLRGEAPAGWTPAFADVRAVERELLVRTVLNREQLRAWRTVFHRPLSLVWGPPGTGKTYLLAWMLLGLAAASCRERKPFRILVSAATHRAIVNVLARLAVEAARSGASMPLRAVKLRGSGNAVDEELDGTPVEVAADARLPALLREAEETGVPLIVGSTVWSLWKQMRGAAAADEEEEDSGEPVRPLFDAIVIDEASQMKVAESLIALSAMRPGAQVILCGDDRQLAPVRRARYEGEMGSLFGSAFSHFAERFPKLPLRESRRMNAALVAYPRELFYPGLVSIVPERRIRLAEGSAGDDAALRELFLDPDAPVVLCTYRGVRASARNPFEARLAARLAVLARELLLDPRSGRRYSAGAFVGDALAVLSPHRAQNSAILAELQALGLRPDETPVVDTVERMQGNEREVVIVSYGVADREYAEAEAEFLLDPNRFNVSITRARSKLIVLVSEEVLDAVPADEAVLAGSMALKGYVDHCADDERVVDVVGPTGEGVTVRCRYRRLPGAAPMEEEILPGLAR
ncbi:MAG TPA: AAA domain-containing protein [Longimicrobiaceae bacterium]|nr:AAA domain-containing protein [Longimicrobiaceae bacterium]